MVWGARERGTGAEGLDVPEFDRKGAPLMSNGQQQAAPAGGQADTHRTEGSDTRGPGVSGTLGETACLPRGQGPGVLSPERNPSSMCPTPSPTLLQIKSQDLFLRWVAQLRAHRLAPRLDVPSGTHRKVRRALGQETWGFSRGGLREQRDPARRAPPFLTPDSPHRFPVPSFPQRLVPRLYPELDLGRRCPPG